jgi:hypothetical protein
MCIYIKGKVDPVIEHHGMKTYGAPEIKLHAFLT